MKELADDAVHSHFVEGDAYVAELLELAKSIDLGLLTVIDFFEAVEGCFVFTLGVFDFLIEYVSHVAVKKFSGIKVSDVDVHEPFGLSVVATQKCQLVLEMGHFFGTIHSHLLDHGICSVQLEPQELSVVCALDVFSLCDYFPVVQKRQELLGQVLSCKWIVELLLAPLQPLRKRLLICRSRWRC